MAAAALPKTIQFPVSRSPAAVSKMEPAQINQPEPMDAPEAKITFSIGYSPVIAA